MKQALPLVVLLLVSPALCQETPSEPATSGNPPDPTATPVPPRKPALAGGPSTETPRGASLADVVKRSQEEKGGGKKHSLGVITNETLKAPAGSSQSKGGTLNIAPKSAAGSRPATAAAGPSKAPDPILSLDIRDDKGRSEADWARIVKASQARVEKSEAEAKRLEDEVRRLENDFYAWDDGNYRDNTIKPTLDKAREDLKRARANVDTARTAQADLEEDARKSNTPPGWLRPK